MDFMKTFTELLHLMCLGKGDSPSFKVDKVSEPSWIVRKLEDLNALPRNEECLRDQPDDYEGDNQISIGVLDLLGVYYPGDRKVIIFDRLIKRCASSLGINEKDLFEIVCCHELAHAATHLGLEQGPVIWHILTANHSHSPGKSQPEIWHCFDYAPPQKREYYAQIYTYKLFDQRERKDLIDCMEKLALTQPWIYQSYLGDVNIKISDLNADLLRDRKAFFEEFIGWLSSGHGGIPVISENSSLDVRVNALEVVMNSSSGDQNSRSRALVEYDFNGFFSSRNPKPKKDQRYIYAIIIHWLKICGHKVRSHVTGGFTVSYSDFTLWISTKERTVSTLMERGAELKGRLSEGKLSINRKQGNNPAKNIGVQVVKEVFDSVQNAEFNRVEISDRLKGKGDRRWVAAFVCAWYESPKKYFKVSTAVKKTGSRQEGAKNPEPTATSGRKSPCCHTFVEKFVKLIQTTPWTHMRSRDGHLIPYGNPVAVGWDQRLKAYAYTRSAGPDWIRDYGVTQPWLIRAARLAGILHWTRADEDDAVLLAKDIIRWGGLEGRTIPTTDDVRAVFNAALAPHPHPAAPMNSSWTKVAAFASHHLGLAGEKIINDSRVSWAIVKNLDGIIPDDVVREHCFPELGLVKAGRGGTRTNVNFAALTLSWPNAYGKWDAQYAATNFAQQVANILNTNHYPDMPLPLGGTGDWTIWGVGQVLFMEGY